MKGPEGQKIFIERMDHMEKVVKQYEMLVSNAGKITQTMLDGDSGKYVLTVLRELLRDLLEVGNVSGAILVIRKLYEAAGIPFEKMETCVADAVAWVALLIEALEDAFEESGF